MGFSIAGCQNSSVMGEIILQNAEGAAEGEEIFLPGELADSEMLQQLAQGILKGEAKNYLFSLKESPSFSKQTSAKLSETGKFWQSKIHSERHFLDASPKEKNPIREKTFSKLALAKSHSEQTSRLGQECSKSHTLAKKTLETGIAPKSLGKETAASGQQRTQAKTLEHRVLKDFGRKENHTPHKERNETHKKERETEQQRTDTRLDNKQEKQELHDLKQQKEEEQGFAEDQRQSKQDDTQDDSDDAHLKAEKISENFAKELATYGTEESILSDIFKMRISQFDVLILFIEILKLELKSRQQEREARRLERELQLIHMQNVVENYKSQANMLLQTSIVSGVLGIASGALPIVGHMKGDWIIQKFGSIPLFSGIRDMDKDKLFKSLPKITYAMSEMSKSTGQIHQSFSEGSRTFDQHMSDLHRAEWEENTRSIDEIKDSWKGIENFLYQALQMYHDAIRQLYS